MALTLCLHNALPPPTVYMFPLFKLFLLLLLLDDPDDPPIYHDCLKCGKRCKDERCLNRHRANVHAEKLYQCDIPGCRRGFNLKHAMKRHQENHAKKNVCLICGKCCSKPRNLRKHMKKKHKWQHRRGTYSLIPFSSEDEETDLGMFEWLGGEDSDEDSDRGTYVHDPVETEVEGQEVTGVEE